MQYEYFYGELELYCDWKVQPLLTRQLFFRWINQHLRIKQFYGTPENALQTQIWISVCVDVLVAIVKR
jgi:hypothetical protein